MSEPSPHWDPQQDPELAEWFGELGAAERGQGTRRPQSATFGESPESIAPTRCAPPAPPSAAASPPPTLAPPPAPRGAPEQDPRESEDWFVQLPDAARNDIRAQWQRERDDQSFARQLRRGLLIDDAWQTGAVFAIVAFFSTLICPRGLGWIPATMLALCMGSGIGFAHGLARAGRFFTMFTGCLVWLAWVLATGVLKMFYVWHLYELLILAGLCSALGMMRESRRLEGYGS